MQQSLGQTASSRQPATQQAGHAAALGQQLSIIANSDSAAGAGNHMASFVARLMSLNAHEIQCLHADSELMRHLTETQLLMESRLHHMALQSKLAQIAQHQQQLSASQYYDYYAQAAALSGQAPVGGSGHGQRHELELELEQQQRQLALVWAQQQHQLALDLRTTPTGQRPATGGYPRAHPQLASGAHLTPGSPPGQVRALNPKKIKLSEYQTQQLSSNHHQDSNPSSPTQHSSGANHFAVHSHHLSLAREHQSQGQSQNHSQNHDQNQNQNQSQPAQQPASPVANGTCTAHELSPSNSTSAGQLQPQPQPQPPQPPAAGAKKYKGEFDEPTPQEVEMRQRLLARADNYHRASSRLGHCACVLGSEFHGKSAAAVLAMIDQWRGLQVEQRIKTKWDVSDLPKDIPLSDIKKYEELRRDASNGRADFGGASKRKPLGIRGTRQFLLVLYCLWGHPGREDVMQKEGYCPHCFAKIKKANEQSTLVRVVNHFNMKHRRGANPRLSPHRDTPPAATAAAAATLMAMATSGPPAPSAIRADGDELAALSPASQPRPLGEADQTLLSSRSLSASPGASSVSASPPTTPESRPPPSTCPAHKAPCRAARAKGAANEAKVT